MKIDLTFWQANLPSAVDRILELATFKRFSKRRADEFEREIMLAVFCVRTLIERRKLSEELLRNRLPVVAFPKKAQKPVTWLNSHHISELYNLEEPEQKHVDPSFLCNQIIHSYTLIPARDGQQFTHILVCSDFERNRYLYNISLDLIVSLLNNVASDNPIRTEITYNPKKLDYDIRKYCTKPVGASEQP
jgi:hypothetical protein